MSWQPIETAPQDGTRVLLADENRDKAYMQTARFLNYAGVWAVFDEPGRPSVTLASGWPKFWRPLPS